MKKPTTEKEESLLSLIRDAKNEGIPLKEIPFYLYITYLFRATKYLSGYSEEEIKSKKPVRDLYCLRRMICFICFDNRRNERKITEEISKETNWKKVRIYNLLKQHRDEKGEVYKKNFDVLKDFFSSLFGDETEEELFKKLSKFPFYEKKILKGTIIKTMSLIDEELRYNFSKDEKEIYKKISLNEISFCPFAQILLHAIENFFGYSNNQIKSKRKTINIVKIRCVVVALSYKIYKNENKKISLEKIAEVVNKDHATVLHEARNHNGFIEQDKPYLEEFIKFVVFFFSLFKNGEEIKKEIMLDPFVYTDKDKKQLKAV